MKQIPIWTNPSQQRSLIQPVIVKSEIKDFLELTLEGTVNKKVTVFPGMEYTVSFYDASYGTRRTLTGLVVAVYEDQIKLKCANGRKDTVDCNVCVNRHTCHVYNQMRREPVFPPMPTCKCILNPPDTSKYDDPEVYFIPVANIMSMTYVMGSPMPPKPIKGGVKVVLLGISATVVKAIVVNLAFFDDSAEDAVKYVELKVGEVYDICYARRNTTFESRMKILNIEELPEDGMGKPNSDQIVRENIGMNDSVYGEFVVPTKANYYKAPPARRIRLIVDTSETFDGNLEVIMLDEIRDATLVTEDIPSNDNTETPDADIPVEDGDTIIYGF